MVGNFMSDKVLTQKDVHPNEVIKKHLGLIEEHAFKSFMEVKVYIRIFSLILVIALIPVDAIV